MKGAYDRKPRGRYKPRMTQIKECDGKACYHRPICGAEAPTSMTCTLPINHSGPHIACLPTTHNLIIWTPTRILKNVHRLVTKGHRVLEASYVSEQMRSVGL